MEKPSDFFGDHVDGHLQVSADLAGEVVEHLLVDVTEVCFTGREPSSRTDPRNSLTGPALPTGSITTTGAARPPRARWRRFPAAGVRCGSRLDHLGLLGQQRPQVKMTSGRSGDTESARVPQ